MLNELSLQFSGNAIKSEYGDNVRNTRADFGLTIPELFAENREGPDPQFIQLAGLASDRRQPALRQQVPEPHLRRQPDLAAREPHVQGRVPARPSSRRTSCPPARPRAVQLRRRRRLHRLPELPERQPRRGSAARPAPTWSPSARSARQFRFNRYEFYVQDSWSVRPGLTPRPGRALRAATRASRTRTTSSPTSIPARFNRSPARRRSRTRRAPRSSSAAGIPERDRRGRARTRRTATPSTRPTRTTSSLASASPGTSAATGRRWCGAATASTTTSRSSASSCRTRS